jgi:hypothetical protein
MSSNSYGLEAKSILKVCFFYIALKLKASGAGIEC